MRKALSALAFAGFVITMASAASAETITCPVSSAMRTITTPVPAEWWTTPIFAALSETRISNVGGRTTLECVFGNAGIIARYAPDREVCTAAAGGFNCSPLDVPAGLVPLTPLPTTYSTGAIEWLPSFRIDLDTGGAADVGADLWYQAISATVAFITPVNGATVGAATVGNSGYAGCQTAAMSASNVPTAAIRLGSYVCVRTNEGRIAEFRLNNISGSTPPNWSIGYTTWR